MINVRKSQPAPTCLSVEKLKKNGDYKCGDVLPRIKDDFRNKCYICEYKAVPTINVEHFEAHQGDKNKKFDWNNLFLACGHCNNTKLHLYPSILNCTNPKHKVDEWIKYEMKPYPKEKVTISIIENKPIVASTAELLDKVYNGNTQLKKIESANIREEILEDIINFQHLLKKYFKKGYGDKKEILTDIKYELSSYSSFTAFKRWIIRDNTALFKEFGHFFSSNQHS